jgi:hypothetical protein
LANVEPVEVRKADENEERSGKEQVPCLGPHIRDRPSAKDDRECPNDHRNAAEESITEPCHGLAMKGGPICAIVLSE